MKRFFCFVLSFIFLISPSSFSEVFQEDYILGPEDQVEIQITGLTNKALTLPVFSDGKLHLILDSIVAEIPVEGLTLQDARKAVEEVLGKYLKEIQVTLLLAQSRKKIYVSGEVTTPGFFSYVPGKEIADYLGLAGGPKVSADLKKGRVFRMEGEKKVQLAVNFHDLLSGKKSFPLLPYDTIFVPQTKKLSGFKDYFNLFVTIIPAIATIVALSK